MATATNYHHFTKEERVEIEVLKKQGFSLRFIARELDKDVSSVTRELRKKELIPDLTINQRKRLGDWEGDTIVGVEKTIHILTHVDRKSITYDNEVQFNKYEDTKQKLGIPIYFAYSYHSWERGTSENTNGLLREYFPKKSVFRKVTQTELDKKVKLINNRPRKRLNFFTPREVFWGRKPKLVRNQSVVLGDGM